MNLVVLVCVILSSFIFGKLVADSDNNKAKKLDIRNSIKTHPQVTSIKSAPKDAVQPNNQVENLLNEAGKLVEEGKASQAINLYNQALKINPKQPQVMLALSKIYKNQNEYERANEQLISLFKYNKIDNFEHIDAFLENLSYIKNEKTVANFANQFEEIYSDTHQATAKISLYFVKQAKYLNALHYISLTLNSAKNNPEYTYNKAVILDKMNDTQGALKYYKEALRLQNPESDVILQNVNEIKNRIKYLESVK
jgi:tetratricopeptide (TPR) repeat protein